MPHLRNPHCKRTPEADAGAQRRRAMITVCAWSNIGQVPCQPDRLLANDGAHDGRISHGICWAHMQYMRDKLEGVTVEAGHPDDVSAHPDRVKE